MSEEPGTGLATSAPRLVVPGRATRAARLRALLQAARPHQWLKNVLVLAAPGAAGVLLDPAVLARSAAAFACFCLVASGTYVLNDAFDVEADRLHPRKRSRPVAAGLIGVGTAKVCGLALLAAGLGLALLVALPLVVVLLVYVVVMQSYTLWLKNHAVIELAIVSSGFVLRAIAGGAATGVEISTWFLIVTSFASLFIIVGKRQAERLTLGTGATAHRRVLAEYPSGFLEVLGGIAAGVAIIAYCLWSLLGVDNGHLWFELSIIPFVLAMLRYALVAAHGRAGAPEDVFLHDRTVQVLGLLWAAAYAAGVYAG